MRMVVTLKLENDSLMTIIGNGKSKEDIRTQASKLSPRLLGDKTLYIEKSTPIVKAENWEKESKITYKNGNKPYMICFMLDNVVQVLNIEASGVKSAYNTVKLKYGIQNEPLTLIYEVNQQVKKKSAVQLTMNISKDINKLSKLLDIASDKIKNTPELESYKTNGVILVSMLRDTIAPGNNNIYTGLNQQVALSMISSLVYFVNPTDVIMDLTEELSTMSSVDVMKCTITQGDASITAYKNWVYANRKKALVH